MSFARALTDRAAPPPPGLSRPHRFAIYRNNVVSGLIRALAVRYPAVERLTGAEFFAAMAGEFALGHLPGSPVLIDYGAEFVRFIGGFAPAASLPYLADVAALESAWWRAYHAADTESLPASAFADHAPETLATIGIVPHPAADLVASTHPILAIWRQQRGGDGDLSGIDMRQSQKVLVTRPETEVQLRALSDSEFQFLAALFAGRTLAEAAEVAADGDALGSLFDLLVTSRLATALSGASS